MGLYRLGETLGVYCVELKDGQRVHAAVGLPHGGSGIWSVRPCPSIVQPTHVPPLQKDDAPAAIRALLDMQRWEQQYEVLRLSGLAYTETGQAE